jgi:pyruvate carboxylase
VVRTWYAPFDTGPKSGTAEVYLHEMPGGQFTNLKEQAEGMGLGERWHEIATAYAGVNEMFGDIVKVTPSSKVVGDMAIFLVTHGMTVEQFAKLGPDHGLSLPHSVIDMFEGSLGVPEGGWPSKIQKIVLGSGKPQRGRPGARLAPVDFDETRGKVKKILERNPRHDEVLSYIMYPEVFTKYAAARNQYSDVEVLPSPQFFYGMEKGDEITVDIEEGKRLVIKFLTVGEPHPDGNRTVFFELNGQPREVDVRDKSLGGTAAQRVKADPAKEGEIGAPLPGLVTVVAVEAGQTVKKGDRLLVMEAMKMQSTVYSPVAGKVTKLAAQIGQQVEAKDLLMVIG